MIPRYFSVLPHWLRLLTCVCGVVLLWSPALWSHPLSFGSARLTLRAEQLEAELVLDVPEAVLQQAEAERRRELLAQVEQGFQLWFANERAPLHVRVLDLGDGSDAVDIVSVRCAVPPGAASLRLSSSKALGDLAFELSVPGQRLAEQGVIAAGESSPAFSLLPRAGSVPSVTAPSASAPSSQAAPSLQTASSGHVAAEPAPDEAKSLTAKALWDFVKLGFWHIVPAGIDHLLFVASLVLLVRRWQAMVLLLSLFTLGHAVSVALALYGVVSLAGHWIEPLIACSLAYAALEHAQPRLAPFRPLVVLTFGLVHGLGFAGALAAARVTPGLRLGALAGFNLGVELGQLCVALLPWLLLERFKAHPHCESVRTRGLQGIAVVGLLWALWRVLTRL